MDFDIYFSFPLAFSFLVAFAVIIITFASESHSKSRPAYVSILSLKIFIIIISNILNSLMFYVFQTSAIPVVEIVKALEEVTYIPLLHFIFKYLIFWYKCSLGYFWQFFGTTDTFGSQPIIIYANNQFLFFVLFFIVVLIFFYFYVDKDETRQLIYISHLPLKSI